MDLSPLDIESTPLATALLESAPIESDPIDSAPIDSVICAVTWVTCPRHGCGMVGMIHPRRYGRPDLFYNYYTQGHANQANAQMYLSPLPIPPNVGHTFLYVPAILSGRNAVLAQEPVPPVLRQRSRNEPNSRSLLQSADSSGSK